jgi:nitroreductase/FMN reductase [NAD(P)H]
MNEDEARLRQALAERFGEDVDVPPGTPGLGELLRIATQVSHRRWTAEPVAPALVRLLAACALAAPSKSDLQQSEIVDVRDPALRDAVQALIPGMPWIRAAPAFLVFCGSGRRLRRLFERRGAVFPNEHLDAFYNPTIDASLAMMNFMRAAAAAGLACCPISAVRDRAAALAGLLGLPDHVFPVAGLCVGHPVEALSVNPRMALPATLHTDRVEGGPLDASIDDYDRRWTASRSRRAGAAAAGAAAPTWSDEKVKQFSTPQHADWGAFVQSKRFELG